MCPAICGDSGPSSLPYSFDFRGQLKNWLRVQGCSPKLHCFVQQVLRCSSRFQPQDCRSLLNLLLIDATGLTAALPLTRQGMHIFHGVVMFSSVDSPDDREDCFRMVNCGWRHVLIV